MSDEDRRRPDEIFRLKVVEQQGEIKALQQQTNSEIRGLAERINEHTKKISDIETALWGYPKSDEEGLLSKFREESRSQGKKWAIFFIILNMVVGATVFLMKPFYDKWASDIVFNSPSQKWLAEQRRPKVRKYIIHEAPRESSQDSP